MRLTDFVATANEYGKKREPFFFLLDFELQQAFISPLSLLSSLDIQYSMHAENDGKREGSGGGDIEILPVDFDVYRKAFDRSLQYINAGDSYLLNLTFPTEIRLPFSLRELYENARAAYKLYFKDRFVLFSPECFVRIRGDRIFSYPMKGTIDADLPQAEEEILQNAKELWEHNTIIDLIRNDLSMVATGIELTRYRFLSKVYTHQKNLLQVSSEIRGNMAADWREHIGDILVKLLPAGSISGAPKKKTVAIIQEVELEPRGYFTGIFGVFDGTDLDSAVNIRFIEKRGQRYYFRSGGGITAYSKAEEEYREMIDKVYIPLR